MKTCNSLRNVMKMLRFIWAVLLTEFQYFREECEFMETEYRNASYIT